ncbi:hypothetical protein [Streptomyces cavernae]|uniref:hypothetical protein n=1 Tax=Streptomyces cavernae TaxID=2259034 RepID=UPI001EE4549A|nr:hypothetical protein [Streptomyces cavernae]
MTASSAAGERTAPPGNRAHDRHWAAEMRSTIRCTGTILGLLLLVDALADTLTPTRAALSCGLALLLLLILFPPRITAGVGWLVVRGPWAGHRVRTDRLVSPAPREGPRNAWSCGTPSAAGSSSTRVF